MNSDEIIDAYNVVVQDIQNRAANEAARVGNAQRSLGTLAERVATPSGMTSGLANYTYDRTMRPAVDTLTSSLTTTGYAGALENNLKANLRAAKNRYEDAKNAYTVAASRGSGGSTGGNTNTPYGEQSDKSYTGGYATGESVANSTAEKLKQYSWLTGMAYKGDIQQKLYEEWQAGNLDTSDFIAEYYYVDNNPNYMDGYYRYDKKNGKWRD